MPSRSTFRSSRYDLLNLTCNNPPVSCCIALHNPGHTFGDSRNFIINCRMIMKFLLYYYMTQNPDFVAVIVFLIES